MIIPLIYAASYVALFNFLIWIAPERAWSYLEKENLVYKKQFRLYGSIVIAAIVLWNGFMAHGPRFKIQETYIPEVTEKVQILERQNVFDSGKLKGLGDIQETEDRRGKFDKILEENKID